MGSSLSPLSFGTVQAFELKNSHGMVIRVAELGATLTHCFVPNKNGELADVVLGPDSLKAYQNLVEYPYLGATIGRYGNRLRGDGFYLDGEFYPIALNADNKVHLHGGTIGFDRRIWSGTPLEDPRGPGVRFTYTSPDGEQGYPGTLQVSVDYVLSETNEVIITYRATTDRATPINLTNHAYFNLKGEGEGDVGDHLCLIPSDQFHPHDDEDMPLPRLDPVAGTPLDFRTEKPFASGWSDAHPQIAGSGGFDHSFLVQKNVNQPTSEPTFAARVTDPTSGRRLEVYTTEPAVHLYTGNSLAGGVIGKSGRAYGPYAGFCLETQHFADSPNVPAFPSTILRPGEEFFSVTKYSFSAS